MNNPFDQFSKNISEKKSITLEEKALFEYKEFIDNIKKKAEKDYDDYIKNDHQNLHSDAFDDEIERDLNFKLQQYSVLINWKYKDLKNVYDAPEDLFNIKEYIDNYKKDL